MLGYGASVLVFLAVGGVAVASEPNTGQSSLLVTNNDNAFPFSNTITLFTLSAAGTPTSKAVLPTGGSGIGGGFFAAARVLIVPDASNVCVFASEAAYDSNDIAAVDAKTQKVIGRFTGSQTDSGLANGIGLATNSKYIYANFTSTSTIGTFQIQSGCTLSFLGDVFSIGLNSGLITGMATRGNMMVVSYGDGSIESFDISNGEPVSHGDVQYSTGAADDHFPNGIDITKDGHFYGDYDRNVGSFGREISADDGLQCGAGVELRERSSQPGRIADLRNQRFGRSPHGRVLRCNIGGGYHWLCFAHVERILQQLGVCGRAESAATDGHGRAFVRARIWRKRNVLDRRCAACRVRFGMHT